MISDQGLNKFIKLYEQKYSVKLKKQEALNLYIKLLRAVKIAVSDKNQT
ncbi:MAG: hypothetical protein PF572_05715 [Patescibacteria group bacterium]|nr:hypothetical protein [Patescibacteria group bacterium]